MVYNDEAAAEIGDMDGPLFGPVAMIVWVPTGWPLLFLPVWRLGLNSRGRCSTSISLAEKNSLMPLGMVLGLVGGWSSINAG